MARPLEKEFEYFLKHQDKLAKEHPGQYVVIKGDHVLGVYDDEMEAIRDTQREHELGTFLVQRCEPGIQNYTQTYHSRVAIA